MNPTLNQNQLDFLAEKVMKRHRMKLYDWADKYSAIADYFRKFHNSEMWVDSDNSEPNQSVSDWQPHINKSQAMEVLERCANHLSLQTINLWKTSSNEWCMSTKSGYYADSLTLTLTICLFALKLYEYKEGGDAPCSLTKTGPKI